MDAIIINGTLPDVAAGLRDEENLLIESCTVTPNRDATFHMGANGAIACSEHRNPTMTLDFKGIVTARSGLPNGHPGDVIAALENFDSARHGFDPTDGQILLLDPKTSLTNKSSDDFTFKAVQYPFMV